jgi:hypothetical protein
MASFSANVIWQWFLNLMEGPFHLRTVNGKLQFIPRRGSPKKWSGLQKQNRNKFEEAAAFANRVQDDPELSKRYQARTTKKKHSAYHVAFTDFLKPPKIHEIEANYYRGKIGDKISVRAYDDFKVVAVHITITDAQGRLIEEGDAHQNDLFTRWIYKATVANPKRGGTVVNATAFDLPGNKGMKEVQLMDW